MDRTPLGAVVTSAGSEMERTTVRLSPTTMVASVYVATAPSWDP
ncbi:MAG: hypothetical protein JWM18_1018 [Chloroflexi bacterium]|nr:hypothetical protein [Chloroflexota bacterium]